MYIKHDLPNRHADSDAFLFSTRIPTSSLLMIPEELIPQAIEAKKISMMYMKDLPITGNPSKMLDQLTEFMKNPFLRDEIYCFLVKQTTANMQQSSETRGWELLNFVLTVQKPSRNLYSYILHYIINSLFNNETQVATGLETNM